LRWRPLLCSRAPRFTSPRPNSLELDEQSMLRQWKPSYTRGFAMQASLALASALFGLLGAWRRCRPRLRVNETRALIKKWGDLHAVRAALGLAATLVFLWALN
jgi:hypothetical protein